MSRAPEGAGPTCQPWQIPPKVPAPRIAPKHGRGDRSYLGKRLHDCVALQSVRGFLGAGHVVSGQVDGEDTAMARTVAHAQATVVGFNAAPRNRQAETESALVRIALREWREQRFRVTGRQAAAVVLDVDEDAVGR